MQEMEGGNGVSAANGITHSPLGEQKIETIKIGSPSANCVPPLPLVASLPPFNPLATRHSLLATQ